jgi:F-box/WD-40 domain protein MET30
LPITSQQQITDTIQTFASASADVRKLILSGMLAQSCVPQLSFLSCTLPSLLRLDIVSTVAPELALKIMQFLDAKSLCHAAQVCRAWYALANDDVLWHRLCVQHINKRCEKCGWCLPRIRPATVHNMVARSCTVSLPTPSEPPHFPETERRSDPYEFLHACC